MNIEPRTWLWLVAAGVFVWCGLLAFAEAVVKAIA